IEGATPPIVTRALFERAKARLEDPERRRRREPTRRYALRGRLRCSNCGGAMTGHVVNRGRHRYYRCTNGSSSPGEKRCRSGYIRLERLEAAVRTAPVDLLTSPDRLLEGATRAADARAPGGELGAVLSGLEDVDRRRRRLAQLYTRGELPADVLGAEPRALAEQHWALKARKRDLTPATV